MSVNCKVCNTKNKVSEVYELKDIKNFTARYLVVSKCRKCFNKIAVLIEARIPDGIIYKNNFSGFDAEKIIKREKGRLKNKVVFSNKHFSGWIYGENKEIKNRKGQVIKLRQYSKALCSGKRILEKEINVK